MIEIKCTGSDTIDIDQLTEFQGALKERDAGDVEKIIKSIKKHGFSFPFFVWAHAGENGAYINHVFDGHGRLMALKKLRAQGEEIPELPCVYVSAKNEAEAKELLLKLNSQYGHMTADSVAAFLGDIKIDFDELALPSGVIDFITESTAEDFEFPELKSGDRDTMCTMNFTLTAAQVEIIKAALSKCDHKKSADNPNSNGNAITYICERYLNGN